MGINPYHLNKILIFIKTCNNKIYWIAQFLLTIAFTALEETSSRRLNSKILANQVIKCWSLLKEKAARTKDTTSCSPSNNMVHIQLNSNMPRKGEATATFLRMPTKMPKMKYPLTKTTKNSKNKTNTYTGVSMKRMKRTHKCHTLIV